MALTKINNNTLSAVTTLPSAIATGTVLQVVQAKLTTEASTTSTSYASTNLTAAITPSATSSKIIAIIAAPMYLNTGEKYYYGTVYRASSDLAGSNTPFATARNNGSSIGSCIHINFLDSPSSTSELTYTYYHKVDSGATGYISINDGTSTITLMEIAG
tara:strand:- start:110 stop:586 length:477 start_codon:yes stop_codon:yes gene_type:complete